MAISKAKLMAKLKNKRNIKTYKSEFYGINSIFGNDWARYFALIGGREAGKSYTVMQWAVNRKFHLKEHMKFYWFRLTDDQVNNLLANGGADFIDPDIARNYGVKLTRKGNRLYTYKEDTKTIHHKNGQIEEKKIITNEEEFVRILSCSTFYATKGVGYFDKDFNGEYFIVLDEMNREQCERNSFDIVYAFINLLENVTRSTKCKLRVIMIGNTLDEASDILSAFNFIPDGFGRFKIKSKKLVVDNIMPNEKYIERRKDTLATMLLGDNSTFSNEVEIDRSLLCNKRLKKTPIFIIKFGKPRNTWFTLWNNSIIAPYNGEIKDSVAMRRYLDSRYDLNIVNEIFDRFDARSFKFVNLACFKQFQKQLRLIKKN